MRAASSAACKRRFRASRLALVAPIDAASSLRRDTGTEVERRKGVLLLWPTGAQEAGAKLRSSMPQGGASTTTAAGTLAAGAEGAG